jgi:hypothetical protein
MNPGVKKAFQWAVLVLATLVVIGVFVQVYLIATYILGGLDHDILDAHKDLGGYVHMVEVLAFLAAIGAYWKRWGEVGLVFALAVVGTLQLAFVDTGGEWVKGLHGLLALVVLILAHATVQHAVRALGLGRHGAPQEGA